MPGHHELKTAVGRVTHIFAHRLIVTTDSGPILADLGPEGAAEASLREGDHVVLLGEVKPSELKVRRLETADGRKVDIGPGPAPLPPPHPHELDPAATSRALEAAGLTLVAGPLRRPKHFEVLGRRADGALLELHVEWDGRIRKSREGEPSELKWSRESGLGAP